MSTCPDSGLYSAYVDGEVPSPWKEKLESHIASCPACAKKTGRLSSLRRDIGADARTLSETELASSFERLFARRAQVLSGEGMHRQDYLAWTRLAVRIPVPALAAMLLAAFFLPAYFALKNASRGDSAPQYATVLPSATGTNISQTVKSLATSSAVYSPDLLPYATTASLLSTNRQELFNILSFASQFETAENLFSDAEIIIIKMPKLTQFSTAGEQLFTSDQTLKQAAGFYR